MNDREKLIEKVASSLRKKLSSYGFKEPLDELDAVEAIMAAEDHHKISIPDDAYNKLPTSFKEIGKLVDDQKKMPYNIRKHKKWDAKHRYWV